MQAKASSLAPENNRALVTMVEENEYRHIFQSCSIAMVRFSHWNITFTLKYPFVSIHFLRYYCRYIHRLWQQWVGYS